MQFHASETRETYTGRAVDPSWKNWVIEHINPKDKDILDIGCGGGIYSDGFASLGARSVTGIDQSQQYIDDANQRYQTIANLHFIQSDATHIALSNACSDIIFERALIHHLTPGAQLNNGTECYRLLRDNGLLVVQDRTLDDVLFDHQNTWIRSTLIQHFPRLPPFEKQRRPDKKAYENRLKQAGFRQIQTITYPEIRKIYASFEALKEEILSRKGKSILFELSDLELLHYCDRLEKKHPDHELIECDYWTIWLASK